jgi:hypothetical protein
MAQSVPFDNNFFRAVRNIFFLHFFFSPMQAFSCSMVVVRNLPTFHQWYRTSRATVSVSTYSSYSNCLQELFSNSLFTNYSLYLLCKIHKIILSAKDTTCPKSKKWGRKRRRNIGSWPHRCGRTFPSFPTCSDRRRQEPPR